MTFEDVWKSMIALQGDHVFCAARGLPFTYSISGGVVTLSRKANPITRATVRMALKNAADLHVIVPGPKSLRCFGDSYLYPVFQEIGIIKQTMWTNTKTRRKTVCPEQKEAETKPKP